MIHQIGRKIEILELAKRQCGSDSMRSIWESHIEALRRFRADEKRRAEELQKVKGE